jgi:hypothetical protein
MSVQGSIVFGLPRLANRMVQDIFWGIGLWVMMVFITGSVGVSSFHYTRKLTTTQATTILIPNPVELSLERKTPTSGLTLKEEDLPSKWRYSEHLRTIVGVVLATTVMLAAYNDINLPRPLITGFFAIQMTNLRFPRMSLVVKLLTGLLVSRAPTATRVMFGLNILVIGWGSGFDGVTHSCI